MGNPEPPEIGRSARVDRSPGRDCARLSARSAQRLRILHFCDLHAVLGDERGAEYRERDARTMADLAHHIRHQRPDLLVFNGDSWHENPDGRGQVALQRLLERVVDLGVPWTFTWGNHDVLDDYQKGHDALENARNSLYRGGATHGDYRVEITVGQGRQERVALDLLFANSNREGLGAWQLNGMGLALKARAATPALAFFHIPIRAYHTLYRAGVTPGIALETVCYEREDGGALAALQAGGRLRACFCGHDHVNDYAVRAGTLELAYGRATGYSGYGGEKVRKGAKVIDIDLKSGQVRWASVFADGSRETFAGR